VVCARVCVHLCCGSGMAQRCQANVYVACMLESSGMRKAVQAEGPEE